MGSTISFTTSYRYAPDNDTSNVPTYGYLYNWPAVMHGASSSSNPSGVQGICPNGWHVPSDVEWMQLINYVGGQTQYQCDNSIYYIAKALASTIGWNSSTNTCDVGNESNTNNATGFSALPAGHYDCYYYVFGNGAYFWSSAETPPDGAYYCFLYYNHATVDGNSANHYTAFSVRCVRD
jgi:uncharacterized protein (TIGR02145 family)